MIRYLRTLAHKKPYYITTPIFYVNAKPHLGHLYSMLLCDVRARWESLNLRPTYFTTGTDEHGLKIQTVAEKQGINPKELVDNVSQNFKFLANKLQINYDRFIRTTDEDHVQVVKYFWNLMVEKDLIYKGEHSGWYSVSDETFYPETQIEEVVVNGTKKMISKETKNEVIFQKEINYFFKLSEFQDRLIEYIETHPDFIIPTNRYNELLSELESTKLSDLSVSRPSSRLTWGIEVPNDPSQKIYVWFDALLNYLTSVGYPETFQLNNVTNKWPVTNLIGKDIIRFHCIYWPIFLMAAEVELPTQIVVHSHWLSEGFKMSKSLGNVVDPIETCDIYGEDSLRFFLMEYSNISTDCNYSEKSFKFTRDNLIGKYANLMTRCGGPSFDIQQSVNDFNNGKFSNIDTIIKEHSLKDPSEILQIRDGLLTMLKQTPQIMEENISSFETMKAIQQWWSLLEKANQFLQISEPWTYNKKKDIEVNKLIQSYYILIASEAIRISSILILPVIPNLAGKILDRLNVDLGERNGGYLEPLRAIEYGSGANGKHELPIKRLT